MTDKCVDIVITYVDDTDQEWRKTAALYKNIVQNVSRYRSYNALKLQIDLMFKFVPFIKNVFVIVSEESQIPKELKDYHNVIFITHSQIIPKKYLPTFNSCTIEMFLHLIPGLQEHFIYFNDDMFIIRKCEFEDFFFNEKPVIGITYNEIKKAHNMFQHQCVNSYYLAYSVIPRKIPQNLFFKPAHCATPMFKSDNTSIFNAIEPLICKSLTKHRHKCNLNQYLFTDFSILKRYYYVNPNIDFFHYFKLRQFTKPDINYFSNVNIHEICVNDVIDNSSNFNIAINILKQQLKKML